MSESLRDTDRSPTLTDHGRHSAQMILLVCWGSALIWEIGVLLASFIWLRQAFKGFLFGESHSPLTLLLLAFGLSLLTMPGPMVMGSFLAHNWRRGLLGGLTAVLIGPIGLMLGWLVWSRTEFISSPALIISLVAGIVITSVLLITVETFLSDLLGLAMGLAIGAGLSVVGHIFVTSWSDNLFSFTHVPPVTWVSIVYFPKLLRKKEGRRGFVFWILLILATFSLSFLTSILFGRMFG